MDGVLRRLWEIGILPAIQIDDESKAVPLARALAAGGVPCAQITGAAPQVSEAVRQITAQVPGFLAGAGDVYTAEQADDAIKAGAAFLTGPRFDACVAARCAEESRPFLPACTCPDDLERTLADGLEAVLVAPAGREALAERAAYPSLMLLPTGVSLADLGRCLAREQVLACGCDWLVPAGALEAGRIEEIPALCAAALSAAHGFALAHVGVNTESEEEALRAAGLLAAMLGAPIRDAGKAFFTGEMVEWMKRPGAGKHGHIGFYTNHVGRALARLEKMGFSHDPASEMRGPSGRLSFCYLKQEIGGFALHLMERKEGFPV